MFKLLGQFKKQLVRHKFISGIVILLLAGGGYWGYTKIFNKDNEVRYATAKVKKGTLIVFITGSGQVSASSQVDVKPKASGEIVYVGVSNGQEVKARDLILQLDAREAKKAVRDAEVNLESSKLSLEKLKKPADDLSLLQAENSLAQAKESKQKAEDDLKKAYDDGFNTAANALLDLPAIMTGLYGILFNSDFGANQENISYYADAVKSYDERSLQYKSDVQSSYQSAKISYDKNFSNYKAATRYSDNEALGVLLDETYGTTKSIAEAIKNSNNLVQFYKDKLTEHSLKPNTLADTHLSSLNSYTSKTNSHLLNLLSVKRAIQTSKETIVNAERSIAEKTEALVKLKEGPDALDIKSAELTVKQRENALLDAREKLADYFVRVPFDGIIAKLNVKKSDNVSSATAVATLITKQKIAEISLNEIDVAKVGISQKATLTFDAVPGLTITGEVAEVDAAGTVSQGVVTYTVKVVFDTQDERVKTGMSVSAAIVTEAKPDVLMVPNSSVKSQGGANYVEVPEAVDLNAVTVNPNGAVFKNSPRRQMIEAGAASDEFTEVISGLKEGDVIITRTIQSSSGQQTQAQQTFRVPGVPGGGGGFRR